MRNRMLGNTLMVRFDTLIVLIYNPAYTILTPQFKGNHRDIFQIYPGAGIFNSYTMGTCGPRAEDVYIRQTTSAHGITNM